MNTNKQLNKGNTMKKAIMMISLISIIGLNLNTAAKITTRTIPIDNVHITPFANPLFFI